ncbi:PAS domain-containing protein [Streptomyces sp. NPDC091215]|uniref:PAS domain-containing protein n=1 Tax=Streptomyces sp. NPDC091215 TaxID=3155192 RepID=UPI0034321489
MAVVGVADVPLMVVDNTGVVLQWSSQAETLLGRAADEVVGRSITPLLSRLADAAAPATELAPENMVLHGAGKRLATGDLRVRSLLRRDGGCGPGCLSGADGKSAWTRGGHRGAARLVHAGTPRPPRSRLGASHGFGQRRRTDAVRRARKASSGTTSRMCTRWPRPARCHQSGQRVLKHGLGPTRGAIAASSPTATMRPPRTARAAAVGRAVSPV